MIKLKILCIKAISSLLKVFWVIPLKKKTVFFMSFNGKQFSDSPKAIYEELSKRSENFKMVWGFTHPINIEGITDIDYVKVASLRFFYYFCTAKFIIVNDFFNTYLPIRKSQVLINTWHGGGWFKKVGLTDNKTTEYDKFFFEFQCKKISYFVASSEYFVDTVLHHSFNYQGKILRTGMPRNAIFFQDNIQIKETIRNQFGADENTLLLLYAPTFRSYAIESDLELDLNRLEKSIAEKFKKKVRILFRAHHLIDSFPVDYLSIIDVTYYPDMQQLLLACDILISDYSSCMWDAAIQDKLVLVYAPDAQRYIDNRGFFMDIREWPFLLAFNNNELAERIDGYEKEKYLERLHKLVSQSRSYENANAASAIADLLVNLN